MNPALPEALGAHNLCTPRAVTAGPEACKLAFVVSIELARNLMHNCLVGTIRVTSSSR